MDKSHSILVLLSRHPSRYDGICIDRHLDYKALNWSTRSLRVRSEGRTRIQQGRREREGTDPLALGFEVAER